MKDLFPGYYRPSEEEFRTLWENCTFVFDTNVLLDLYRYPEKAREEFLSVLTSKGIFHRFWLPHQAAMEFQRNRLKVAWSSLNPLDELKKEIEVLKRKTREIGEIIENGSSRGIFGNIKKDPFQTNSEKEISKLENALDRLKNSRQKEIEKDSLREEIDKLITGKIGSPPKNQQELDQVYTEGEKRFSLKMPPGYLDQTKEPEEFLWGTLSFKRKFGDLILWKQIIKHAKEQNLSHLIFVTNDNKSDWWWMEEYQGKKTFGPRPELIEEIKREANLKLFYMYNVDRFLEFAKKYLEIQFEDSSLEQIKEVTKWKEKNKQNFTESAVIEFVLELLENKFPGARISASTPYLFGPDIEITTRSGKRIGFEIKTVTSKRNFEISDTLIKQGKHFKQEYGLNELWILLLILPSEDLQLENFNTVAEKLLAYGFDRVYFGTLASGPDKQHLEILASFDDS